MRAFQRLHWSTRRVFFVSLLSELRAVPVHCVFCVALGYFCATGIVNKKSICGRLRRLWAHSKSGEWCCFAKHQKEAHGPWYIYYLFQISKAIMLMRRAPHASFSFLIMCVVSFTFVTCEFIVTCKRARLNTIAHCIAQLARSHHNQPPFKSNKPSHQEVNQATREIGNQ